MSQNIYVYIYIYIYVILYVYSIYSQEKFDTACESTSLLLLPFAIIDLEMRAPFCSFQTDATSTSSSARFALQIGPLAVPLSSIHFFFKDTSTKETNL